MTNLNQLLLGRFASMESDVVDNEDAQPVADAELGTDDLGNQLDSTTLPETAMSEADEHLDDVVNFAVRMRDGLKQEAVAVELDGTMYFI